MSEKKITFGRVFWPTLVAVLVVSVISLILFFVFLGGMISSFGKTDEYALKNQQILQMTLSGEISENSNVEFDKMNFDFKNKIGLSDVLYGFEQAAKDSKIKGIFLEVNNVQCGIATAREIRNAINKFEKSGKFVVAYNSGEVITQKEYYISSAANEVYGFPLSNMEFVGLGAELTFFKNTLDKLDVEVQVIRGKNNDFKSAVEPFFRTEMSDSSRLQINRYMQSLWSEIRSEIAVDRKVSAEKLNEIAENVQVRHSDDAVTFGMMDKVMYRDEIMDLLRKKIKLKGTDEIDFEQFEKYAKKKFYASQTFTKSANIAVILAEGEVSVDGDGLSSEKICKYLREARLDKNIKTIVLRINSPGGSALASEEIWREVKLANDKKKVIVSMGDVAASGGYYIATPATRIFANPSTITGSIGVFGMIPYTGKMLENKIGLTFDRVSTNKHAVLSTNRKLTEDELVLIQTEVDEIYTQFLSHVAKGRNFSVEKANVLGRGRVWTGSDALRIGLVDELGGINEAIQYAAKKAGVKDVKLRYWPEKKEEPFMALIEQFQEKENGVKMKTVQTLPEELLRYYGQLKKLESMRGIQMRLPYEISFN